MNIREPIRDTIRGPVHVLIRSSVSDPGFVDAGCVKSCNYLSLFKFHNHFLDLSSQFLLAPLLSDVTIKGELLPQSSEEPAETCCELETYLAEKFKKPSSAQSKKMRKELQKVYIVLLLVVYFLFIQYLLFNISIC